MSIHRWTDISTDPNSAEARAFRRGTLLAAWRGPVEDRIAYLSELVKGRRVLDIGVVDHAIGRREESRWLHGAISKCAGSCLGVDVLPEPVAALKARGFNVLLRDITSDPLDETFETIVCGEVIEHLGNPEGLFRAAAKMLAKGGRLVLTTPNPYFRDQVSCYFRGKFDESVDHVTLLTPNGIAEFAEREGLRLETYRGVIGRRLDRLLRRLRYNRLKRLYGGPGTDRYCQTLIYECVKASD